MKIGYRWYIVEINGRPRPYEPHEMTFNTIEEAYQDATDFGYPKEMIGIDLCSDDDGFIEVVKNITYPTKSYTPIKEDEDE